MTTTEAPSTDGASADAAPTDATTSTTAADRRPAKKNPGLNAETLALGAIVGAARAFATAVFAVGLAARAVSENDGGGGGAAATASAAGASVDLTEFAIEPSDLTLPAGGGVVTITNAGTVDHNLSVDGQTSEMIPAGGTAELDLTGLADGSYEMTCQVAGHADAGMKGTLTVG